MCLVTKNETVALKDQVYTPYIYFIFSGKKITRIYSAQHIYFVTKKYNEKIELMIPFGEKGLKFSPDL